VNTIFTHHSGVAVLLSLNSGSEHFNSNRKRQNKFFITPSYSPCDRAVGSIIHSIASFFSSSLDFAVWQHDDLVQYSSFDELFFQLLLLSPSFGFCHMPKAEFALSSISFLDCHIFDILYLLWLGSMCSFHERPSQQ
jgi:hypothetical protein